MTPPLQGVITKWARDMSPRAHFSMDLAALQRALDALDAETFDDIADAHVLVLLEGHAAFLTGRHFLDLVLEALERRELALVDHHVVADQAHAGTALDQALGDPAAGDLADLGDVEDLEDLGVADEGLAALRLQQPRHRRLHVIHEVVDDVVVADLDAIATGEVLRLLVGADVEADDDGVRCCRQGDVGFSDAADAAHQDLGRDFLGGELVERGVDGLDGTLHVALDDERELGDTRGLELAHHLLEAGGTAALHLLADETLAVLGNLAGPGFGLDDGEAIAGAGHAGETEDLDRGRGAGFLDLLALVVDQHADAGELGTGDEDVTDAQGAALHQHRCHRTAAAVELGFDDEALGPAVARHLELQHLGLQQDGLQQLVEAGPLEG